jgi:hypothetical protein
MPYFVACGLPNFYFLCNKICGVASANIPGLGENVLQFSTAKLVGWGLMIFFGVATASPRLIDVLCNFQNFSDFCAQSCLSYR